MTFLYIGSCCCMMTTGQRSQCSNLFIYHYKQSIIRTVSTERASCTDSVVWNLIWGRCTLVWWGAGFGQWPVRYLLGLWIWLTSCPLAITSGSACRQRGLTVELGRLNSQISKKWERSRASGTFHSSKVEHHWSNDKNRHRWIEYF